MNEDSITFDKWLTSEAGRQALINAGGSQGQAMRHAWNAAIEIGKNLSNPSSRPDKCSAESHALKRMGGYSICPICDENISGG